MKDQIVVLHGPDRVRKRPAVVFGSADAEGALQALKMLMNVFAREAVAGFCKYLSVTLYADGSVGIYSADRGMRLDETVENGNPVWQNVFCELPVAPRNAVESSEAFSRRQDLLYGDGSVCPVYFPDADYTFDLCCVQFVCEYMTLEAVRDGVKKTVRFEKGFPVAALQAEPTDCKTGTYIRLKFDSAVFGDVCLFPDDIWNHLKPLLLRVEGFYWELYSEENGSTVLWRCHDALSCLLQNTPCFTAEKEAEGKDRCDCAAYKAQVRISIAFSSENPGTVCFHNYNVLLCGGTHADALRAKIREALVHSGLFDCVSDESTVDILMKNLVLLVQTHCSYGATVWANAERTAIKNSMITNMTAELIDDGFVQFLQANRDAIEQCIT